MDMTKSLDRELSQMRVLVVEDEPLIAMDYVDWLNEAGATVVGPCSRVSAALKILENEHIDVAVIDFVLTDGTSETLQAALAEKRVPFVLVTAYPRVLVRGGDVVEPIHNKPMTNDILRAAVVEALRTHEKNR